MIRAVAARANVRDIVVIGSQAIPGSFPHPPERLQQSMDADVYPKDHPELSIVIDGAIGELSIFHSTFGYYAHGVGEETAILPSGWESCQELFGWLDRCEFRLPCVILSRV